MTVRGVDAAGRLSGAAVAKASFAFAARYLDFGTSRVKTFLSRAEVQDLRVHGVAILAVHEIGTDDVLAGHAAAVARAHQALADLDRCGMAGAACYWTSDRDIVLANEAAVVSYAQGWASVLGAYGAGVYGDYEVLDWVVGGGSARYGWQAGAAAWSGRRISPHAHIVQTTQRATVGDVQCDVNEVRAGVTDYGQWPRPAAAAPQTRDEDDDMVIVTAPHRGWMAYYQEGGAVRLIAPGEQGPLEKVHTADGRGLVRITLTDKEWDTLAGHIGRGLVGQIPGVAGIAGLITGQTAAITALAGLSGADGVDGEALAATVTEAARAGTEAALHEALAGAVEATAAEPAP